MADNINEEHRIITMDDVARELGISKTTVSRALSGKGRISPETVKKVQEYAKEHDFRPNAIAKGLSQSRTYNLAVTLPADFGETEVSFFKECVGGICREAMEYDYDIMIAMLDKQLYRMLKYKKVDGVIMTRVRTDGAILKEVLKYHVPVVVLGSGDEEGVIYVDNNNFAGSLDMTDMLIKAGKHTGIIGGDSAQRVTMARLDGYLKAHADNHLRPDDDKVILDVTDHRRAAEAIERIVNAGADALVCMDDNLCIMAMDALHEKNIRVPEDMSVVSLYDSKNLENISPAITSIHFKTRELGKLALRRMMMALGIAEETDVNLPVYHIYTRKSVSENV